MTNRQEASTAHPAHVPWLCHCVTLATTFVITGNASHSLRSTIKIPEIIQWHLNEKETEFCRHCAGKGCKKYWTILKLLCPLVESQNPPKGVCALEVAIKEEKSFRLQNGHFIFYEVGILSIIRRNKFYYTANKWPFNAEITFWKRSREGPISGELLLEWSGRRGRAHVWLILGDS